MRIILYTGKGGVGKTTVAAATSLLCAAQGLRTLVLSTDAAHSLADSFDRPLGAQPTVLAPNLWGLELDVYQELDRNWASVQSWLRSVMSWRGIDAVIGEEMASLPGMEELAGLLQLLTYHERGDFDLLIVDCAPSGETLRLLSFPEVMRWWMNRVFPLERTAARIARPLLSRLTDIPLPDDSVFASAHQLYERLEQMRTLLTDPDQSSVRLVLNPERMVIREAQRTFSALNLYGYASDLVVCNRMLPEAIVDPYFDSWKVQQGERLREIEEDFAPLTVLQAPMMRSEVTGLEQLNRLGHALYGDLDPAPVLHRGRINPIRSDGNGYVLSIALPFIDAGEVALSRTGDELLIRAGRHRRTVILPRVLIDLEAEPARFHGDTLEVRFSPTGAIK
ncbi:MAG: ArsA family ATPase [Dehalococcoidia bacterium]